MLVRLCRLFGAAHAERVYGPDVMLELCRRSPDRGYRHFFYGGAPGVAETLAARLQEQFPGLCYRRYLFAAFPPTLGKRDCRRHSAHQRQPGRRGLDRIGHTETGDMGDRQPQPPARSAVARRGRRVRLSRRHPFVRPRGGCARPGVSGSSVSAPSHAGCGERYIVQLAQFLGLLTLQVARLREFPISAVSGEVNRHDRDRACHSVRSTRPGQLALACSRLLDFFVAMLAGIMVLPVLILAIIAIKLVDPGPAFYIQNRHRQRRPAIQIFQAPQHALEFRRLAARISGTES